MKNPSVLPYTLLEFITDVDREFAFLKTELGMTEDSSSHTARATPFGFSESVFTTSPTTTFASARGKVTICHDSRGAVEVNIRGLEAPYPTASVQELASAAGELDAATYGQDYDSATETACAPLRRLAVGLRKYAPGWLKPDAAAM